MVVSRMKLRGSSVRFVVVSATVPNIQDVADWVGSPSGDGPATVKEVCELKVLRPVGLSDRAISSEKSSGRASCRNSCTAFLGARTRTTLSLQRHSTTSCTACCNSIATTSQFLCSALLAKVSHLQDRCARICDFCPLFYRRNDCCRADYQGI